MKAIRTATIIRNDSEVERVKLNLEKDEGGYIWRTEYGEDCNLGIHRSVRDAQEAAQHAWGAACWDLRATWL